MPGPSMPEPSLTPGSLAVVTFGPSKGTVVRLSNIAYAPPGCDGCAVHTLQPLGPIWRVSKFLEWDVVRPAGLGIRRYRLMTAPVTGLAPIATAHDLIVH
jgi:hypothetical protein